MCRRIVTDYNLQLQIHMRRGSSDSQNREQRKYEGPFNFPFTWYGSGTRQRREIFLPLRGKKQKQKQIVLTSIRARFFLFFFFFTFYYCIVPMGFLPWEIRVTLFGESQLQQSRATQPTVHAECFSVSIIHRTLKWTTGSLTCAQM